MIQSALRTAALCAILGSTLTFGQSVADLPPAHGVYYRAGNSWLSLPFTLLRPYTTNEWKWWLSVGGPDMEAGVAGAHSIIQIPGEQPVFFVRGLTTAMGPRLISLTGKSDHRKVKMHKASFFDPRSPFYDQDAHDIELTQLAGDVVAVRPKGRLAPGEYAVVTTAGPDLQRMFLGFDFRVR